MLASVTVKLSQIPLTAVISPSIWWVGMISFWFTTGSGEVLLGSLILTKF